MQCADETNKEMSMLLAVYKPVISVNYNIIHWSLLGGQFPIFTHPGVAMTQTEDCWHFDRDWDGITVVKGTRRICPMYERAMSGAEKIDHEVCVNELFKFVTIHPNK